MRNLKLAILCVLGLALTHVASAAVKADVKTQNRNTKITVTVAETDDQGNVISWNSVSVEAPAGESYTAAQIANLKAWLAQGNNALDLINDPQRNMAIALGVAEASVKFVSAERGNFNAATGNYTVSQVSSSGTVTTTSTVTSVPTTVANVANVSTGPADTPTNNAQKIAQNQQQQGQNQREKPSETLP